MSLSMQENTMVVDSSSDVIAGQATPGLDLRVKALYGIGGSANAIKMAIFGLFALVFYTTVMGLPGTLVGIASAIGLVWDAVIDPYIGYLSDRVRFRFGRRHTFMLIGSATMGLSFWAFFSPPRGLSTGALFLWLLVTGLLVRTMTSVYAVPYLALGAELSQDYHERTSIAGIRGAFALLGTLAAAVLSFVLFFPDAALGVDPKLSYAGYPAMGLAFGLVMTVVGLVATMGTLPCRAYFGNNGSAQSSEAPRSFFASLVVSLRNPSFRAIFISLSLFFLAIVINSTLSIYYLTYYVKITASTVLSAFQLTLYVGGLVGIVFWLRISKEMEKRRLYLIATLVTAVAMLGALLLFGEGNLFGTGNVSTLLVGHGLVGFFASIVRIMPASMIADVTDEDELMTGLRREGSFFGIFTFGQQLAASVSLLIVGVLVDRFAGLIPGQAQQSSLTINRTAMLYSLLPATLLVVAAALIMRYTLDRRRVKAIQAELGRRHMAQRL
jgi:GPH family glycoside/pentoside/hexuronide:cation symporter